MERKIAMVYQKTRLHGQKNDCEYWRSQPYQVRMNALEEIRSEYQAWLQTLKRGIGDVKPGFQRVYRIIKR